MKDSIITDVNKLKIFENNLTKNEKVLLKQLSKYDETSYLNNLKNELDQIRNREIAIGQHEIRNIYKPLQKLKVHFDENDTDNLDLKELKTDLVDVQENIHNLKQKSRISLEKLQKDENDLKNDLYLLGEKIDSKNDKLILVNNRNYNAETSSNLCPEVQEFTKFVMESGGHENRWLLEDHNLFLKLRNKYKSEVDLAKNLNLLLPDLSENQIIRHEMWYRRYLELKDKQLEAIKNWRRSKLEKVRGEKNEMLKVESCIKKAPNDVNRETVKKQLSAWKEEKSNKLREIREDKKKEIMKRKENELKAKQRQEQIKKEVELWKSAKDVTKKQEQYENEKRELVEKELKSWHANKLIKVFQLQDQHYINKMKYMRERTNSLDRIPCRPDKNYTDQRDFGRLLKPTQQWLYRTSSSSENTSRRNVCFINSIPKLAIPEWRKAMQ